jgi:hypothetical protein
MDNLTHHKLQTIFSTFCSVENTPITQNGFFRHSTASVYPNIGTSATSNLAIPVILTSSVYPRSRLLLGACDIHVLNVKRVGMAVDDYLAFFV